ncbi:MAG: hypothetical protein Q8K23_01010, partial [Sulfuritalea sp.]|nr:hypothetical protein [Sulfuritalea sp.]
SGATVEYSSDGTTWVASAPAPGEGSNTVYVRQTDAAGNTSGTTTISFTLDTTAPIITGPSGAAGDASSVKSIAENTTAVATLTASEAVTWSVVGGADAAKFTIDATGKLVFVKSPDYENPGDSNADNTYVVRVLATDIAGNISTQTITVTVTDVTESIPGIDDFFSGFEARHRDLLESQQSLMDLLLTDGGTIDADSFGRYVANFDPKGHVLAAVSETRQHIYDDSAAVVLGIPPIPDWSSLTLGAGLGADRTLYVLPTVDDITADAEALARVIQILSRSSFSASNDRSMLGTEMLHGAGSTGGQSRDAQPWGSSDDGQRRDEQPWGSSGEGQNRAAEPWGGSATPVESPRDSVDELRVGAGETAPLRLAAIDVPSETAPKAFHRSFSQQIRMAANKHDVRNIATMLGEKPAVQSGMENMRRTVA